MTGLLGEIGAYRETEDTSDFYDYDITGYYDLSFVSGANTRSQSDDWHEEATNDWTGSYDESGGYGPGGDEGVYDSHYTYDYTLAYDGSGTADSHTVDAAGFANSHDHYAYDGSREDGWVETDAGSFEDGVDSGFYQSNESFSGGGTFDTDGNSNSQYSAGGITTTTNGSYYSHEVWSDDSTSVYKELYLDGETLLSESVSTGTADDNTTGHSTGHSTYTTLSSSSSTDTTSDSTYTVHWQWNETSRFGLGGTSNTADNSTTESRSSTYSMTYSCDGRWSTSGGTINHSQTTPTVWTHSMGTPPTGSPTTPSYTGPTSSRWDDLIAELLNQAANAYNTPAARAAAVDAALAAFDEVDADANGQNGGAIRAEFSDPENNTGGLPYAQPVKDPCEGMGAWGRLWWRMGATNRENSQYLNAQRDKQVLEGGAEAAAKNFYDGDRYNQLTMTRDEYRAWENSNLDRERDRPRNFGTHTGVGLPPEKFDENKHAQYLASLLERGDYANFILGSGGAGELALSAALPFAAGGAGGGVSQARAKKKFDLTGKSSGGSEHTSNASPSNRGKHEDATATRGQDYGGEKGDAVRDYPRKRPDGWRGPWPPTK